jgi:hypothetical protein
LLCYEGFERSDPVARREAQRCLANAMFLKPETRKVFVQVGGTERFVKLVNGRTARRDADDDFLLGRIGFLLTSKKDDIVERLVNTDHILDALVKVFVRPQC